MRAMGKRSVSSFLTVLVNVSWYAVALGLALSACLVVVSPFLDVSHMTVTVPVSFSLDARTHRVTASSPGIEGAQSQGVRVGGSPGFGLEIGNENDIKDAQIHVRGSLRFPTSSRALFGGNAILLLVFLALVFWVIGLLRAVFRTLRDGQPFVPANAARIHWIGFAVIFIELARSAVVFFENRYAMTHFAADGLRFDARPDLNGFAILYGVIILVIAEVFRAGTRLDEDQSLTI
jgi:hypothetical protein